MKEFAQRILPDVKDEYQATLELFVYTLNSSLKDSLKEVCMSVPTPLEHINKTIYQKLLDKILKKITDHGADITVTIQNNPQELSRNWPKHSFIIIDKKVNKKITVAFGQRGTGAHVEIIKIEPENQ